MKTNEKTYWPITTDDVYVKVFNEILSEVDHSFFESACIRSFKGLSNESKYLVTRLYLRKDRWIRLTDLEKYLPRKVLVDNIIPELTREQWMSETPPITEVISDVASQKELMEIAKSLGLKSANSSRNVLVNKLIQLEQQQQSMKGTVSSSTSTKIQKLLQIDCCRLDESKRNFLFKLEQLYLYPIGRDATLETIYLTYMKKHSFLKYKYKTQIESPIFNSKEAFEAYSESRKICISIEEAIELSAQKIPESITSESTLMSLEQGLMNAKKNGHKEALRVYGRGMFNISQIFMKMHRFLDEYTWIKKYLEVSDHTAKRGVTLIRKLLLEMKFLQESGSAGDNGWLLSAVNTYFDALCEVSDIEHLDLERKTSKLLSSIRDTGLNSALSVIISSSQPELLTFKFPTREVIAVPVKAESDAKKGTTTSKASNARLTYADGYDVETTALLQYTEYKGGHFENSMMLTILWLLTYDLVFDDSDQFRCAYQAYPMNIQKGFNNNIELIQKRMENIKKHVLDNRKELTEKYPQSPKPYVGAVNWSIPEETLIKVLDGLGNSKAKAILNRILSNYYKYSSGFPDLTLWHNDKTHTKFVEVKSANDTLSDNQILWIKFLLETGVDVEICKFIPMKKAPKRKREAT